MPTYVATKPESWVRKFIPSSSKEDAILIDPAGNVTKLGNVVTGYKMVVNEDRTAYDSFIEVRGEWEPYSIAKQLSHAGREELDRCISIGSLVLRPTV